MGRLPECGPVLHPLREDRGHGGRAQRGRREGEGRPHRGAPRAAPGPDLAALFVGSEGTLGIVSEATLRLRPRPAGSGWAAYAFEEFGDGLDCVRRILRRGADPAMLRLFDV